MLQILSLHTVLTLFIKVAAASYGAEKLPEQSETPAAGLLGQSAREHTAISPALRCPLGFLRRQVCLVGVTSCH